MTGVFEAVGLFIPALGKNSAVFCRHETSNIVMVGHEEAVCDIVGWLIYLLGTIRVVILCLTWC